MIKSQINVRECVCECSVSSVVCVYVTVSECNVSVSSEV